MNFRNLTELLPLEINKTAPIPFDMPDQLSKPICTEVFYAVT